MTKATQTTPPETKAAGAIDAPSLTLAKGFRRMRSPHYHLVVGNELLGKVLAVHRDVKSKFGKQTLIEVVLQKPCLVREGVDKASKQPKTRTAETGSTVRFQARAGMGPIADMLHAGDELQMVVTGQVETDKGNPAWTFDVAYNPVDSRALENEDGVDY